MTVKTRLLDRLTTAALGLCARRGGVALVTVVCGTFSIACDGSTKPGSKQTPLAGTISPSPRLVRVEQDTVVVEGRWFPIEAGSESPVLPNAVRVVCARAQRSCKEDLTRLAGESGVEPVHEALEYRIDEWTKWGKPAGKLVASRRDGTGQVEIRVSLRGLAAEKVVLEKGRETHWRIE
jgi:hypothetical protein